jgi:hypothetical protein
LGWRLQNNEQVVVDLKRVIMDQKHFTTPAVGVGAEKIG